MRTREHELYPIVVASAKADGFALYRVRDSSAEGKSPFDIGGCGPGGEAVAVEVKALNGPMMGPQSSASWGIFELHQRAWLRRFCELGGLALLALHFDEDDAMVYIRLAMQDFASERTRPLKVTRHVVRPNFMSRPPGPSGLRLLL